MPIELVYGFYLLLFALLCALLLTVSFKSTTREPLGTTNELEEEQNVSDANPLQTHIDELDLSH